MSKTNKIKANQQKLVSRYKTLMEQAYNFRQTDSGLSDVFEFKAIKLLNKLNRLKYLTREDEHQSTLV